MNLMKELENLELLMELNKKQDQEIDRLIDNIHQTLKSINDDYVICN